MIRQTTSRIPVAWVAMRQAWIFWVWVVTLRCLVSEACCEQFRLGYFPNVTHAQALYARATGNFEKKIGMPIKWVAFHAGPTAIESMFGNAVDATFVGPSPSINGYIKSRGEKFVIVAGSASGGAGLIVRKDAGIQSDKDFAGKTIATPLLGNTQDIAARMWLQEKGYRMRERGGNVTVIALSSPDQLTMFKKKQIHGAWTVEPWLARLEVEGNGELFLEEKSLWPEGKYVTTHLIVNKGWLDRHQETMKKLLAALVEVTQQINSNKVAAASLLNAQLKVETGKALKDEVMERAMARVEFTWDPVTSSLKHSAEAAHRIGFLRKAPQLQGIYSLALLNEVLKDKQIPLVRDETAGIH